MICDWFIVLHYAWCCVLATRPLRHGVFWVDTRCLLREHGIEGLGIPNHRHQPWKNPTQMDRAHPVGLFAYSTDTGRDALQPQSIHQSHA